jgi:hypothetical protein
MIEEPKNLLDEISSDPNFLMILAGAVIWFIGAYMGLLSPLFLSTGFVLVCFSAALTSLKRPVTNAWPGLLLGGLFQIVGYYLGWIPFLGNGLVIIGAVVIVYFAIPLALQRGELPVLTKLQKLIESKKKEEEVKDIEAEEIEADEEAVDAEIIDDDSDELQ